MIELSSGVSGDGATDRLPSFHQYCGLVSVAMRIT